MPNSHIYAKQLSVKEFKKANREFQKSQTSSNSIPIVLRLALIPSQLSSSESIVLGVLSINMVYNHLLEVPNPSQFLLMYIDFQIRNKFPFARLAYIKTTAR